MLTPFYQDDFATIILTVSTKSYIIHNDLYKEARKEGVAKLELGVNDNKKTLHGRELVAHGFGKEVFCFSDGDVKNNEKDWNTVAWEGAIRGDEWKICKRQGIDCVSSNDTKGQMRQMWGYETPCNSPQEPHSHRPSSGQPASSMRELPQSTSYEKEV